MRAAVRSMSSVGTGPTSDGMRPERVGSRYLFIVETKWGRVIAVGWIPKKSPGREGYQNSEHASHL